MATMPNRSGRFPVRDVLAESLLLAAFLGSLGLNAFLLGYLPINGLPYYIALGTLSAAEMSMGIRIAAHCSAPVRVFLAELRSRRRPPP